MKRMIVITVCFIALLSSIVNAQEFKSPESAAYNEEKNSYYYTCFGSGDVIEVDAAGNKSFFVRGLTRPVGMIIYKDALYLLEGGNVIKSFSLPDASPLMDLKIEGAIFLNDITTDSLGHLYVTDSRGKAIYKINIATQEYSIIAKATVDGPNGIMYDGLYNRLIFVHFTKNSAIQSINLNDNSISTLAPGKYENLDGIAIDRQGNIYISCWGPGDFKDGFPEKGFIYKFDHAFSKEAEKIPVEHFGPADIYFNKNIDRLVVPYFLDNMVETIKVN